MVDPGKVESWFQRRRLTLDLAGLSDEERRHGQTFWGGSQAEYVTMEDSFGYDQLDSIIFNWGNPATPHVIAQILEYGGENPDEVNLAPFSALTVIGDKFWLLAVQSNEFDPTNAYFATKSYIQLPYEKDRAEEVMAEYLASIPTSRQLIGKVGPRWFLFEMATDISPGEIDDD